MQTETKERTKDPMAPENRCKDFDDECDEVMCKTRCWMHAPEKGWCPYLKTE